MNFLSFMVYFYTFFNIHKWPIKTHFKLIVCLNRSKKKRKREANPTYKYVTFFKLSKKYWIFKCCLWFHLHMFFSIDLSLILQGLRIRWIDLRRLWTLLHQLKSFLFQALFQPNVLQRILTLSIIIDEQKISTKSKIISFLIIFMFKFDL